MNTWKDDLYLALSEKENELYHHGREGMKWGVRNGPPYPLHLRQLTKRERDNMTFEEKATYNVKRAQLNVQKHAWDKSEKKYASKKSKIDAKIEKSKGNKKEKLEKKAKIMENKQNVKRDISKLVQDRIATLSLSEIKKKTFKGHALNYFFNMKNAIPFRMYTKSSMAEANTRGFTTRSERKEIKKKYK